MGYRVSHSNMYCNSEKHAFIVILFLIKYYFGLFPTLVFRRISTHGGEFSYYESLFWSHHRWASLG